MAGLRGIAAGIVWALLTEISSGQTALTVTGRVFDPSDAVLSGATVTLTSAGPDLLQTTTDTTGLFQFASVAPGRDEIRAEYKGFKTARTRLSLRAAGDGNAVRLVLPISDLQETVRVEGGAARIGVSSQDNLDTVRLNPSDLESLPVLDGDVITALTKLL